MTKRFKPSKVNPVSWIHKPIRIKFTEYDRSEHHGTVILAIDVMWGELQLMSTYQDFPYVNREAKQALVRKLHQVWRSCIAEVMAGIHAVVMVMWTQKYGGKSRYRPPGTWTVQLVAERINKLKNAKTLKWADVHNGWQAARWMRGLAMEGLLEVHTVKSPHGHFGGQCEPYYTLNMSYPGFTAGEVAMVMREREAKAAIAAKVAARKTKHTKECPLCFGDGDARRSDDSSRHVPDPCGRCNGTGKVLA